MKGFVYRPLSPQAATLRKQARRLAHKVERMGSTQHEVHDGYLLRATSSPKQVTVTALDPAAVWLFLHHQLAPDAELERVLGVRALDRAAVLGDGPDTALTPTTANALAMWAPGAGYYHSLDTGVLGLLTTAVAVPYVYADRVGTLTLGNTSDYTLGSAPFTARLQLYGVSSHPMQTALLPLDADTSERPARYRYATDWLLPEAGLQALLLDSHARLAPRHPARYTYYTTPAFAAHSARDALAVTAPGTAPWHADVVVGGAYVSQPTGPDAPPAPEDPDPARLGSAGVWLTRLRRPDTVSTETYPLAAVWSRALPLTSNADPDLVPSIISPDGYARYQAHGVTGVGLLSDPAEGGRSALLVGVYRDYGEPTTSDRRVALQLHTVDADGLLATTTLRKVTTATQWHIGREVTLFGVLGLLVVEADVSGGTLNQATLSTWHVDLDGVMRAVDLGGWLPFTDVLTNPTDARSGALFGQGTVPVVEMGDGKVGLLARASTVTGGTAEWALVVIDQVTGVFVEARGVVGSALHPTARAFLSVVVPETRKADDSVVPAVLLCGLGSQTRISRDGGLTWTLLFEGGIGLPVYMGNRLHRVELGQNL